LAGPPGATGLAFVLLVAGITFGAATVPCRPRWVEWTTLALELAGAFAMRRAWDIKPAERNRLMPRKHQGRHERRSAERAR